jgi:hypothetical protein
LAAGITGRNSYHSPQTEQEAFAQQKRRRSLAGISCWTMRLAQLFFTSEQTLFSSGMKASSAGMVAISL